MPPSSSEPSPPPSGARTSAPVLGRATDDVAQRRLAALGRRRGRRQAVAAPDHFEADVAIIGGGPSATWAAIKAAEAGATVLLADKGYCGVSGPAASSGIGAWYVEPDPDAREAAMASREGLGGHLADRSWMARVLDETYAGINELAEVGFPFPVDGDGVERRGGLQGPEYMRLMRSRVRRAGVTILDHSPALELLVAADGSVGGFAGVRRQAGSEPQPYRVSAGAVIIATGGCAFLSGALGTNTNTGDGALFAVEAGAELSGMEFSNSHGIAPAFASVTKGAFYSFANFYHQDGTRIDGLIWRDRSGLARLLATEQVLCRLDKATDDLQQPMRYAQPNFFLPFDRRGIDPFRDLFPIKLVNEGTVRGTGGIRIVSPECATSVAGLFAAGDAATRELICGGFTGGGAHNTAWSISSGIWAGRGAARHAASVAANAGWATRPLRPTGTVGLRPTTGGGERVDADTVISGVQQQVFSFDRNYFRHGPGIAAARAELDPLWNAARASMGDGSLRAREAGAILAAARWAFVSAAARTETRGMHKRLDHPGQDPAQQHRMVSGGLDEVWAVLEPQLVAARRAS